MYTGMGGGLIEVNACPKYFIINWKIHFLWSARIPTLRTATTSISIKPAMHTHTTIYNHYARWTPKIIARFLYCCTHLQNKTDKLYTIQYQLCAIIDGKIIYLDLWFSTPHAYGYWSAYSHTQEQRYIEIWTACHNEALITIKKIADIAKSGKEGVPFIYRYRLLNKYYWSSSYNALFVYKLEK